MIVRRSKGAWQNSPWSYNLEKKSCRLLIQNPGAAPVEGYTLLGVSTTRNCGVAGTIGQFGSGAKHAINTLLRAGLKLLIYCGKTRLEFATRDDTINDGLVDETDQARGLQAGRHQQQDTRHGLVPGLRRDRLDRPFDGPAGVRGQRHRPHRAGAGRLRAGALERRPAGVHRRRRRCPARDGFTRVYVEVNDDVQRFYGELPRRFLHFSSRPELVKESLLPKADRNLNGKRTAMIYKEGVLVREIEEAEEASVYDYNFHDGELKLDESRIRANTRSRARRPACSARPRRSSLFPCSRAWSPRTELRGDFRLILHGPVVLGPRAGTEASVAAGVGIGRRAERGPL